MSTMRYDSTDSIIPNITRNDFSAASLVTSSFVQPYAADKRINEAARSLIPLGLHGF